MKLFKILLRHYSQKDSEKGVDCFLVAESEESVFDWLDKKFSGIWTDRDEEDGLIDIYDDDYNVIGQETYKEKMIRLKGEYFDDDAPVEDAYYGVTHYGWEEMKSVDIVNEVEILERFNILEFVDKEQYQLFLKSKKLESKKLESF